MKNLQELYKIQAGLKSRIGYNGPDKFEKMLLAMIVEFAEAANDWQGFKYWKKNNEPKGTLLEEYVDGLHFILEQGLDLDIVFDEVLDKDISRWETIEKQFLSLIRTAAMLPTIRHNKEVAYNYYKQLVYDYIGLGYMLGFTDAQISAAYLKKVAVNYERQNNGY